MPKRESKIPKTTGKQLNLVTPKRTKGRGTIFLFREKGLQDHGQVEAHKARATCSGICSSEFLDFYAACPELISSAGPDIQQEFDNFAQLCRTPRGCSTDSDCSNGVRTTPSASTTMTIAYCTTACARHNKGVRRCIQGRVYHHHQE